jgi:hypothetical protein
MIFGGQPKETPDELANRLQREGRVDQLEKELRRYKPGKLSPKDKASFYHLWGITAFRRGDRATAFERFKKGVHECPDSAQIRFSLGQEHEARREIEQMFACFDSCSFPNVPSSYVLAAARYAYLWGDADRGTKYVAPIADAYFQLGSVDDHFVYVRGLPFFSQTWSYLVAFAWMSRSYVATDDLLKRCKSKLHEGDFDKLGLFYECHKQTDYGPYVEALTEELRAHDPRFPSGYQRTQLVALRVAQSTDTASGLSQLADIDLAENDFPWLSDVALIHKARLLWKAGNENLEAPTRLQFMAKQKLLFEPDHAYAFAFLDYQERLRPRYQAGTR